MRKRKAGSASLSSRLDSGDIGRAFHPVLVVWRVRRRAAVGGRVSETFGRPITSLVSLPSSGGFRPRHMATESRSVPRCERERFACWAVVMRSVAASIGAGEDHVAMGEVNPEESLEIGRGVFKRLGDCTGSEIESAIGLIAQSRIERAWIAEQAAGADRGELTIARRFFADATDAERDLIAYWQMVKLVEEAQLRYERDGDA